MHKLEKRIFTLRNKKEFEKLALDIFRFQAKESRVYKQYLETMKVKVKKVKTINQIPFLPISLFKKHIIISGTEQPVRVFESSGTTGQTPSRHYVVSEDIYKKSFVQHFEAKYGNPEKLCILALLPSYMERGNSSLIYMMDHLIKMSRHTDSGFYLNDYEYLKEVLEQRNKDKNPCLLLGVSYALLDMAEKFPMPLEENIIIMETGGMKGKRKEMIKEELHSILSKAFQKDQIHSEYGMTELFSQAYAGDNGKFVAPKWMKVIARDMYDPMTLLPPGQSGGLNIIDLANLYSCCFIATGDLGKVYKNGDFELSGRFDEAEIRGCNLMIAE